MERTAGILQARFERRGDTTALASLAWRPPFQALRPLYPEGQAGPTELVVATLGPGLLGGDDGRVEVEVGPRAHARVTTTGATRVMPARQGQPAAMAAELVVEPGALLEWLPRPTILQADAIYRQTTRIALLDGAAALVADVLVPGRLAAGELFAFAEVDVSLEVRDGAGRLLVAERTRIAPGCHDPRGPGLLPERHVVMASLFVLAPGRDLTGLLERVAAGLPSGAGATALPNDAGLLVRALAPSASAAEAALAPALAVVRPALAPDAPHSAAGASLCARSGAAGVPLSVA